MQALKEILIGDPTWAIVIFTVAEMALIALKRYTGNMKSYYLLIPIILIVLFLGIDFMFESEKELLEKTIIEMGEAYQEKRFDFIEKHVTDTYRGYRGKRDALIAELESRSKSVELLELSNIDIILNGKRAEMTIHTFLKIQSSVGGGKVNLKWKSYWVKYPDGWKIEEVLEPGPGIGF